MKYKIQATKPAEKPGGAEAAAGPGIPENTMYAWTKAARERRLNTGSGPHAPVSALPGSWQCCASRLRNRKKRYGV